LRKLAAETFAHIDVLVCPTAPTVYTVEQVLADPIELNSRLGTYTNFVNLLDLCGVAVPASLHADATPFGITILAPAGADALAASIARKFQADTGLRPGGLAQATAKHQPLGG
jgi:allophanate hydrolase